MGLFLTLALVLASPFLAAYFRIDRLAPVLCLLSIVFPITSASAVHQSLVERRSGFKTLARIEIVSSVVGLTVAITLAYLGYGVYSLVWNSLVSAALSSTQLWLASPWRPKKIWSAPELRSLWGFSGNLTGFNFINFFARNADSLVIGHLWPGLQSDDVPFAKHELCRWPGIVPGNEPTAGRAGQNGAPVFPRPGHDRHLDGAHDGGSVGFA
jgi:O-antigen/teichoic acid export membrane protein